MIKAAVEKGWLEEINVVTEILTAIRRAGADFIITYYAKEFAEWTKHNNDIITSKFKSLLKGHKVNMFENLTDKLTRAFKHLSGQARLTEENIQQALRDVRTSLLEADVALPVVKRFIEDV